MNFPSRVCFAGRPLLWISLASCAVLGCLGLVFLRQDGCTSQIGLEASSDDRLLAYCEETKAHMQEGTSMYQGGLVMQLYMAALETPEEEQDAVNANFGELLDKIEADASSQLQQYSEVIDEYGVRCENWKVLFLGTHESTIELPRGLEAHMQLMAFGVRYDGPPLKGARFDVRLLDMFGEEIANLTGHEASEVQRGFSDTFVIVRGMSEEEFDSVAIGQGTPVLTNLREVSL
jgi:hypothetical protein